MRPRPRSQDGGQPPAPTRKSPALLSISGPPPVLPGESATEYHDLLAQIVGDVKPNDVLEQIWTEDIASLTWEAWCLRRIKNNLVAEAVPRVLPAVLSSVGDLERDSEPMRALIEGWKKRKPSALTRIDKYLRSANFSFDVVTMHAYLREIENIERIERAIAIAEARRNAAIREIDRHRAAFAYTLRESLRNVEDAEFEEVEPKIGAPTNDDTEKSGR